MSSASKRIVYDRVCDRWWPAARIGGETVSSGVTETEGAAVASPQEDGIVAELCLHHPRLVLQPTVTQVPDARVEPSYQTTDGDREFMVVAVAGVPGEPFEAYDEFERALEDDETVYDPVVIDQRDQHRVYRVTISSSAIRFLPRAAEIGGHVLETTSSRQGWIVRLRLPDRNALVAFNEYCTDHDVRFHVNSLRMASDVDHEVVGLTPKQQQLLYVAYSEGYFDVPRRISQNELADRLGVSKSAISQRLRRSIDQLLETNFR